MLIAHVERYILLRQTLGYKLCGKAENLRRFARFAADKGKTHVCVSTAVEWAASAPSGWARHIRLRDVAHLARFLHAEDPAHEIPSDLLHVAKRRSLPYIYHRRRLVSSSERLGAFGSPTRFDAKFTQRCLG